MKAVLRAVLNPIAYIIAKVESVLQGKSFANTTELTFLVFLLIKCRSRLAPSETSSPSGS